MSLGNDGDNAVAPTAWTVHESLTVSGRNGDCTIELASGDLSTLESNLLVIRASPEDYDADGSANGRTATPWIANLLYHLETTTSLLAELAKDKQEDLRDSLDCWITNPLSRDKTKPPALCGQILVWEPSEATLASMTYDTRMAGARMAVETIYAAMIAMARDNCRTVVIPSAVLGESSNNNQRVVMLKALLQATRKWIRRGLPMERLTIAMFDLDVALVEEFQNHTTTRPSSSPQSAGGFLDRNKSNPEQKRATATVAGDVVAVPKDASLTGQVYIRADGKKVRRVKVPGDQIEIITRPDGTKVRRIKKVSAMSDRHTLTTNTTRLPDSMCAARKPGTSSFSAPGDATPKPTIAEGQIYVRPDGKKVRRVRKTAAKPKDDSGGGSLSGFLDPSKDSSKKLGGAANIADNDDVKSKKEREIYIRADGKKVRRIKKKKTPPTEASKTTGSPPPDANDSPPGAAAVAVAAAQTVSSLSPNEEQAATQYRKMLQMGMPEGAIVQKMTLEGVAQKIMDSVIAREVPAPVTTPIAASNTSISSPPTLDDNENIAGAALRIQCLFRRVIATQRAAAAKKDKKRLKRTGKKSQKAIVRIQALVRGFLQRQKYKAMFVNKKEEEDVERQLAMMRTRLAEAEEERKRDLEDAKFQFEQEMEEYKETLMDQLRAESEKQSKSSQQQAHADESKKIIDYLKAENKKLRQQQAKQTSSGPAQATSSRPNVPSLSPENEQIASQYRKLLQLGMQKVQGAVMQKMAANGVTQDVANSVFAGQAATANDSSSQATGTLPGTAVVLSPEDENAAAQFRKMLRIGMPKDAVAQKMAANGVSQRIVEFVLSAQEISTAAAESQKESSPAEIADEGVPAEGMVRVAPNSSEVPEDMVLVPKEQAERKDLPRTKEVTIYKAQSNIEKEGDAKQQAIPAPPPVAQILEHVTPFGGNLDSEQTEGLLSKLADSEKRQQALEKKLSSASVAIAEEIDYDTCREKVAEISQKMSEIGGSDVTHPDKEEQDRLREEYFKLEQEMEKYSGPLQLSDAYKPEQEQSITETKWESDNLTDNLEALKKIRRHMPVEVRKMSEAMLTNEATPNGRYLPKSVAKKFKRTNILQLIRRAPDDVLRMHPSILENTRVAGLTLTERRALHAHLRNVGTRWKAMKEEKLSERKWTWYCMLRDNFKQQLALYESHVAEYGPPGAHPYATRTNPNGGCPLIGRQCPLKADKLIDYDNDYGFPDTSEYEASEVQKAEDPGAKALLLRKEKKASERAESIKGHYKGMLLPVTRACRSCEEMDDIMDKIENGMAKLLEDILANSGDQSKLTDEAKKKEVSNFTNVWNDCKPLMLEMCGRSGLCLDGKPTDSEADPRSSVECSLAEEVCETFDVLVKFATNRLKKVGIQDTGLESTIDLVKGLIDELHKRNLLALANLGVERASRSRPLKTHEQIEFDVKVKLKAQKKEEDKKREMPLGRGGLLEATKAGRGRGIGGRGSLIEAITARAGGRGRGVGGRGLLDVITNQGGGGGRGRGDLIDAIRGRGRGGRGHPAGVESSGRGGLLAAIRGRGGEGSGGLLVNATSGKTPEDRDGRGDDGVLVAATSEKTRDGRGDGGALVDPTSGLDESKDDDSASPGTLIVLSFAENDTSMAQRVTKALEFFDGKFSVVAKAAQLMDDFDQENNENDPVSDIDIAARVIALITPNYVRNLACLDQFNECLLSSNGSLQPLLVKDTDLPKYLQVVQFHDVRSGRLDKLFQALSSIMYSLVDRPTSTSRALPQISSIPRSLEVKKVNADDINTQPQPEFDIFVSYASKMRAQANATVEILRHLRPGIRLFVDVNELHAGARWQQTLYNALDTSCLVLLVLTPAFLRSSFCREEAAIASLRNKEGRGKIVAVEAIPAGDLSEIRSCLPKELLNALVDKETVFEACQRALSILDMADNKFKKGKPMLDTMALLHDSKSKALQTMMIDWQNEPQQQQRFVHSLKVCIVGHHSCMKHLTRIQVEIESRLGNPAHVKVLTPEYNDMDSIDSATILVCVLSRPFLESIFCMNALNIGILRNRTDGGYLIPIAVEALHPSTTPSFVRLLPTLDATSWWTSENKAEGRGSHNESKLDQFCQQVIAATYMSGSKRWTDRTTLISPNMDSQEDAESKTPNKYYLNSYVLSFGCLGMLYFAYPFFFSSSSSSSERKVKTRS